MKRLDPNTYLGHLVAGRDPGDIDDHIDHWHDTPDNGVPLSTHLGFSEHEYSCLVADSRTLEHIVAIRRLTEAVAEALVGQVRAMGLVPPEKDGSVH